MHFRALSEHLTHIECPAFNFHRQYLITFIVARCGGGGGGGGGGSGNTFYSIESCSIQRAAFDTDAINEVANFVIMTTY